MYISSFSADSDYLTKENITEGIYDAVLKLKQAEAFADFLGDLLSYILLATVPSSVENETDKFF